MTLRGLLWTLAATLCAAAALGTGGAAAAATSDPGTVRYPSNIVPDAGALAAALADPAVTTVVFEKGVNPFSSTITVFRRTGLTLCGATKRATDAAIESSAVAAILLEECRDITIRDLTVRCTSATGEGVRMQAVRSGTIEGFVRDLTLRNARFEAYIPVRGTVRAQGLDAADCTFDVTVGGGAGILWEDGPDLRVTRSRFSVSATSFATAAVLVRGASVADSEGDRVRRLVLTRNTVEGDFATGFNLADLVDARIGRNRITFPDAFYDGTQGRAGIAVRRLAASALTDDYEVRSNRIRSAHTGVWIENAGAGRVVSNDLRTCGTAVADTRFGDTGCGLRIGLFGPICRMEISRNDVRKLRSPAPAPAVVVTPAGGATLCFDADDDQPGADKDVGNRVDPGRTVY